MGTWIVLCSRSNMASLTLLVCFLLVTSTCSQPDWFSALNLGAFGIPSPNNGYGANTGTGGNGGYVAPGPGSGGNSGYPAGNPSTGGSGGYVVPRPGGYPAGNPSTGGSGGYVPPRPDGYPAGNPNTGGSGGYVPPRPGGYPAGNPNTGGNGGYVPPRPIPGGNIPGPPSTGTGVSDCKCRIPTLQCVDIKSDGNTAKCPAGLVALDCTCANGCSTTTYIGSDSCRCECYQTEWASARCCKNV